jgi:DNA gyrase inhibitor GyrI
MKKIKDVTRRSFLKSATTGITGLSIAGSGIKSAIAGTKNSLAWSSGNQVNPQISNNLVVCCHDPEMFKNEQNAIVADTFHKQNDVVDTQRIETNMDGMAVTLSGKDNPDEAWSAIFRRPEEKQWNEVKSAIKVNCIYIGIMPRIVIVGKVCTELIKLGVQPSNITIYDACNENGVGPGLSSSY